MNEKFKSTDNVQTDKNSKNGHTDNIILIKNEERRKVTLSIICRYRV